MALGAPERDLLSVDERQIPPRRRQCRRHEVRRCHAACLPKPPCADRRRHPGAGRGVLTRASSGDRRPESAPLLMPPHRRSAWRPQFGSSCPLRTPPPSRHRNPFRCYVATTS
jgi:hypothetical protein